MTRIDEIRTTLEEYEASPNSYHKEHKICCTFHYKAAGDMRELLDEWMYLTGALTQAINDNNNLATELAKFKECSACSSDIYLGHPHVTYHKGGE